MSRARRVVVVTYDDFQLLDVTGPIEVLHQASRIVGRRKRAARSEGIAASWSRSTASPRAVPPAWCCTRTVRCVRSAATWTR